MGKNTGLVCKSSEVRNQRKFYKIQIKFFCNYNKRCNIRGILKITNLRGMGGLRVRHQLSVQKVPGSKPIGYFCDIESE
jgi:hypothetical protein